MAPKQPKPSSSQPSFLDSLNADQLRAVTHPPEKPLQILAGPGSGKTKVLTCRIAYLILVHAIPPSAICAVTFTNKAASEMRERLITLIGNERTLEVRMGTFHALCALFLRKYAPEVGIERNFTICDADESKKIISTLLQSYKTFLTSNDYSLKEGDILSSISNAKARGKSAADHLEEVKSAAHKNKAAHDTKLIIAGIYDQYEHSLRRSNSLDFDDLLLFGVKLFKEHKPAVRWCQYVLVDEFQDTNVTQYELMRALGFARCISVVGDPDQSIYGWRSAEVKNLERMREHFSSVDQIFLEQNYRSTGGILTASLAIVSQDGTRIKKSLRTSHPAGKLPTLSLFPTEREEATFIASEIKRVVAYTGGILKWKDFSVLLRSAALSRSIEGALQKEGIPCRVLGGHKFFDRLEVKDLLAYLQLIDNPQYNPAFVRAVNIPTRGIGEKTLDEVASRAEKTKLSSLEVVERINDGKIPDIKPPIKRKLGSFVEVIRTLRNDANKGTSPADLIRRLIELIQYWDYLKRTQPDFESRWENVQELISFASDTVNGGNADMEEVPPGPDVEHTSATPLRLFLQSSMLSSERVNDNDVDTSDKVTISTCHAAKGLEWPVVMVPAGGYSLGVLGQWGDHIGGPTVEKGTYPFYRSEDIEEERRLLYVACTRAQGLLYLSHVAKRKFSGETHNKELSEFVTGLASHGLTFFSTTPPAIGSQDRRDLASVLVRALPPESQVAKRITEFNKLTQRYPPNEDNDEKPVTWHPALVNLAPGATFTASSRMLNLPVGMTSSQANIAGPVVASLPVTRALTSGHIQTLRTQTIANLVTQTPPQVASSQTTRDPLLSPAPSASLGKRRLGMGRGATGYPNKKFRPPT